MYVMEVEINTIAVEKEIQNLMTSNKVIAKALRRVIARVMARVRSATSKELQAIIKNDPRKAAKAVKSATYKSIFGGNVSILDKRKASNTRARLVRTRKLDSNPHQRGGNRVQRSDRTEQIDTYFGGDRAFVLRWLNSGADRSSPGAQKRRGNREPGNRGVIAAGGFFEAIAQNNLEKYCQDLEEQIATEFEKIIKK